MYFQPFDLVHPILHELLHGQPDVLPDPFPTPNSALQTEIHPDYPPVPDLPPLHDPLLDVRLNPHQSAQHPAPAALCILTLLSMIIVIVHDRVDQDQSHHAACAVHMRMLHFWGGLQQAIRTSKVR